MRFPTLVTAAALLAASPLVAGRAQQHAPVDAAARPVVPNAFIVQLATDSAFTKRDGLLTTVTGLLADAGIQTRLRQDFGTLPGVFHGASVHVGPDVSAADLALVPGVKRVWPVRQFELPKPVLSSDATVYKSAPVTAAEIEAGVGLLAKRAQPTLADAYAHDTFSTHTMTQVNVTHAAGLLGKGIKIGVIDSGVDYTNSILGGCFGPGCHVSFGYDLVGDAYSGSNTPVPGGAKGPFTDCNEHGTHVSGIIGALPNAYGFTGVAPEATLGMYRIFGCTGSASEDVIFAALMMGIKDNCDVLTLSLGGLGGWIESSPSEILMDHLAKKGVVVTVAAGNAGSEGLFFTQEPADTINAFSVASTDNIDSTAYNAKIVGNGVVPILSAKPLGVGPLPVYFTSTDPTQLDDGCNPLPASTPDLAHSVVVVQRGTCTFVTKYKNVLARASGGKNVTVLIYNKVGGSTLPYLAADSTGLEQVGGLRREDGLALLKLWTVQGKNLTMDFPVGPTVPGLTDLISGGLISDYSIWGPTNDMYGQPTLSAPGGNILSSFPLALGGVGVISGTSMATPFMAGAVAVLMSARRSDKLTPLEIRSLLTTTASLTPSTLAGPELASVVQQGGGLVQLDNAVHAKTFLSPYELLLNDTTHANLAQTIHITNRGKVAATYHFSSLVGQTVGVYNASGDNLPAPAPTRIPGAAAQVHFAVPWIKVQPGATLPLVVTFTPPVLDKATAALFPVYSGWVAIKSDTEAYTVPYFGLAAALLDMPVLDHSDEVYGPGSAYPFILQSGVAGNGTVQHGAHSYAHGTGPTLYSRLAAGTRSLSIDLVKADIKFIPTILNEYDLSNTTVHTRRSLSLAHGHRHRHAHTHPAPVPHSHRHHRHHSHGSQPSPSHGHPTPRTPLYRDVPIVANLFQQADAPRDNLVGGESPSPPFTDSQFGFNGTYAVLAGNKTSSATVDPLVDYRFLIRALKITGDPALEGAYESWLSSSFRIL